MVENISELKTWQDLSGISFDTLILGNGASISLDESFSYTSFFDSAFEDQERIKKIFDSYSTRDFEFIMDKLWHADNINSFLDIEDEDLISKRKSGLIK